MVNYVHHVSAVKCLMHSPEKNVHNINAVFSLECPKLMNASLESLIVRVGQAIRDVGVLILLGA